MPKSIFLFCQNAFGQGWKVDTTISSGLDLPVAKVANYLYFPEQINQNQFIIQVESRTDGSCLYVSDGTQKGTEMILRLNKTVDLGTNSQSLKYFSSPTYRFENKVYFFIYDATFRQSQSYCWETDGTKTGTKPISGLTNLSYGKFETIGKELYYFKNSKTFKLINGGFEEIEFLKNIPQITDKGIYIDEIKKLIEKDEIALFKVTTGYVGSKQNDILIKYNTKTKIGSFFSNPFPYTKYHDFFSVNGLYFIGGLATDFNFIQEIKSDLSSPTSISTNAVIKSPNYETFNDYNASFQYFVIGTNIYASFARNNQFAFLKLSPSKPFAELLKYQTNANYSNNNFIEKVGNNLVFTGQADNDTLLNKGVKFFKLFTLNLENERITELGIDAFSQYSKNSKYPSRLTLQSANLINNNELEVVFSDQKEL